MSGLSRFYGTAVAATHNVTLHTIYRTFGDVRPTPEVLTMIDPAP